jgi:hypothetical protein
VAKNKPFAAEQRRLDADDELDVVLDTGLEGDDAPGIDADHLAGFELTLVQRAAGVDEAHAVAFEPLHDEPLSAEQSRTDPLLKGDADADSLRGAEERVLLGHQLAADLGQANRHDLARIRCAERDPPLAGTLVEEDRHEQRLPRQQPLAGADQGPQKSAGRLGTVAEDGLHANPVIHVHHAPGLGDRRFPRIQLHLDELHVVAVDAVVDLVHFRHRSAPCIPRNGMGGSRPNCRVKPV